MKFYCDLHVICIKHRTMLKYSPFETFPFLLFRTILVWQHSDTAIIGMINIFFNTEGNVLPSAVSLTFVTLFISPRETLDKPSIFRGSSFYKRS